MNEKTGVARLRQAIENQASAGEACFALPIGDAYAICDEVEDAMVRLADLIDRPMCSMHDVGDKFEQVYRCSVCGEKYCMSDIKTYPWRFCPMCGAEVIEREEDE